MPETMKFFGSTNMLIDKMKNWENLLSLKVVQVVSVQCNLVGNQYQQKSEEINVFTANKS